MIWKERFQYGEETYATRRTKSGGPEVFRFRPAVHSHVLSFPEFFFFFLTVILTALPYKNSCASLIFSLYLFRNASPKIKEITPVTLLSPLPA